MFLITLILFSIDKFKNFNHKILFKNFKEKRWIYIYFYKRNEKQNFLIFN